MKKNMTRSRRLLALLASSCLLAAAPASFAGEGAFGWVYGVDLQPQGKYELEQKIDVTRGQAVGSYVLGLYRTSLEYGVTNDFQVAGYLNMASINANQNYLSPEVCSTIPCTAGFGVPSQYNTQDKYHSGGYDGGSLEFIYRLSNPVTSPVGVALYFEPTWGKLEDELEYRLLLQSNFLDDRLVFAVNFLFEQEREKYDPLGGVIVNSMGDILYGASYRFAPNWSAGLEGRFHTDHDGYWFNTKTQRANFIGPNLHYADQKWWMTAAWRHQIGGTCYADGTADCSLGKVWDNHGRNQFILKVGYLLN